MDSDDDLETSGTTSEDNEENEYDVEDDDDEDSEADLNDDDEEEPEVDRRDDDDEGDNGDESDDDDDDDEVGKWENWETVSDGEKKKSIATHHTSSSQNWRMARRMRNQKNLQGTILQRI
eukprot:TRINITY_DN557_c0_g2_i6.p4 TRINITY_DN557_c0_g2~~TRINITY_DN557_c0_g2_i6.p4  ORF type:complete len:120 (+),score=53.17 TRINITY_DN557_c0_g2_i6:1191-1550(+)